MIGTRTLTLQGLDAERDVLRESQRLASERDRELETLRQQVRYFIKVLEHWWVMMLHSFLENCPKKLKICAWIDWFRIMFPLQNN